MFSLNSKLGKKSCKGLTRKNIEEKWKVLKHLEIGKTYKKFGELQIYSRKLLKP